MSGGAVDPAGPAPRGAAPERLAVLRVLVGGYAVVWLVVRLPELLRVADFAPVRFDPVGPWWFLERPLPAVAFRLLVAAALLSGGAFVVGWRFRWSGPAFGVLFLLVAAYRTCWGHVGHTENLVVLHVVLLALAPAADAWARDRAAGRTGPSHRPSGAGGDPYGWPARLMAVTVVATYVLAGWAKLRNGGWAWVDGDVLRHQIAFDNLRKVVVGAPDASLGRLALGHAWSFPPMAWATLAVELGAPLALLGGRWRRVWVAAAWGFHVGIVALMAIVFPYQLCGIAYACFFPVERLPAAARRVRRRARAREVRAGAPDGSGLPVR